MSYKCTWASREHDCTPHRPITAAQVGMPYIRSTDTRCDLYTAHGGTAPPVRYAILHLDAPYIYRGVQVHYCTPLPVHGRTDQRTNSIARSPVRYVVCIYRGRIDTNALGWLPTLHCGSPYVLDTKASFTICHMKCGGAIQPPYSACAYVNIA